MKILDHFAGDAFLYERELKTIELKKLSLEKVDKLITTDTGKFTRLNKGIIKHPAWRC